MPCYQYFLHTLLMQPFFFGQGRFDAEVCGPEVVAVAGRLVAATQALWARVAPKMLPTPAKFHYLFNMRDISKARTLSA